MNAFEHGNLGISLEEKHMLLKSTEYYELLKERSKVCSKTIAISLGKIDYNGSVYILTSIEDQGDGFDTKILDKSFKNAQSYNGRGIYLSRMNSYAIYYNQKGNKVLFLTKCEVMNEEEMERSL